MPHPSLYHRAEMLGMWGEDLRRLRRKMQALKWIAWALSAVAGLFWLASHFFFISVGHGSPIVILNYGHLAVGFSTTWNQSTWWRANRNGHGAAMHYRSPLAFVDRYNGLLLIPLWIPFTITTVAGGLLWKCDRKRIPPGHCQKCGYSLTGNTSGVCPECGQRT